MDQVGANTIFNIKTTTEFEALALQIFRFQYQNNTVYRSFCDLLGTNLKKVKNTAQIPYLPIAFFKSKKVVSNKNFPETIFESSGTTGSAISKHYVTDLSLYERSFRKAFGQFYGDSNDYCILALLPSYLERGGSSLIYMVDNLIKNSNHPLSGFYLYDFEALKQRLDELEKNGTKTLLIGVSFALLDFAEHYSLKLKHCTIMETGGMKGKRKEIIREDLHNTLKSAFGVTTIHSEYGMTELLSQAYSKGNGHFECPKWMKITVRDTEDPLTLLQEGKTGGINIIDLANINSCAFIATQDLGKLNNDGSFEVLGRFDHSDIRGCNLMAL